MKVPGLSFGNAFNQNAKVPEVPALKLSEVEHSTDSYPSSKSQSEQGSNSNRPKLGFLDLTKAKSIQQEHLVKADASKKHAKQVAEMNIQQMIPERDEDNYA